MTTKTYIFGYGSFQDFSSIEKTVLVIRDDEGDIQFLKKNITCCSPILEEALAYDSLIQIVRVNNLKRGWYFHAGNPLNKITKTWTTLGAYKCKGHTCNGTLFPVTDEQLARVDLRETGYIRTKLDKKDITFINGAGIPDDAIVYYYAIDKSKISKPNDKYPILQSYVDLCMSGCVLTDQLLGNKNYEYTTEFVKTTHKWKNYKYWLNDRIYPRRPAIYVPYAFTIDTILNAEVVK